MPATLCGICHHSFQDEGGQARLVLQELRREGQHGHVAIRHIALDRVIQEGLLIQLQDTSRGRHRGVGMSESVPDAAQLALLLYLPNVTRGRVCREH